MSSAPKPDARTLAATIGRRMLPTLVLTMLAVTGVAVVLGCLALFRAGTPGADVVHAYFWIVFWTGLSEGLCLLAGCLVLVRLSRRLARPISSLAAQADALTAGGDSTTFPTDTPVREVNQLAAAFNRLFAAQEARTREIRELSSHVLHDIKTPLTRIRNEAERVFRQPSDARESGRRIAASCDLILNLVNLNAQISRTYAGADCTPPEDVDLAELIRNGIDLYSGLAEEKQIAVSCSVPDALVFTGHHHRLQALVGNLLDNALKYTPPGGTISVAAARTPSAVELTVSDSGPGVPPDALPRIFERFFRADPSRHEPGFGLGLALVHAVATSYRGTVVCESPPGAGATFRVTLPTA